ncbi:MAG: DUF2298 domain-containing protein [Chloroflexota bacterium]
MNTPKEKLPWLYDILLVLVLAVAAFLRFTGSDWGELQHQHPDELSVTSVTYDIAPIGTSSDVIGPAPTVANQPWRTAYPETFTDCLEWGGYFDTACSPLNPQNRGHNAYVYGSLPIFIVRYLADWTGQMGNLKLFGRQMSAVADLITIFLLYLMAARLYNRRVALLAAAFSTFAVMQIQQSHFYTTDNFAVTFMTLAVYFAVEIVVGRKPDTVIRDPGIVSEGEMDSEERIPNNKLRFSASFLQIVKQREFLFSILFGLAFGMAVASKLNAAPLALLLPLAFFIRFWKRGEPLTKERWQLVIASLVAGGLLAIISFRVFQPYAFDGLGLNQLWLDKVHEQRLQATPDSDLPWNLQWARRTHLYSFENLTTWGLGLPLGILAWTGFLWMGWQALKGEWRQHLLLWSWTAFYFGWQSLQYNPTMRYQLPIYPFLAMMAAWFIIWVWDKGKQTTGRQAWSIVHRLLSAIVGIVVLALTAAWAFAFASIYTRDEPRIAASNWIYQNVPAPINLEYQLPDGSAYRQPLPYSAGYLIQAEFSYQAVFSARQDGALTSILLPYVADSSASGLQTLTLTLASGPDPLPEQVLATASETRDFTPFDEPRGESITFTFGQPVAMTSGQMYYLILETSGGSLALSGSAVVNETDYDWSLPFRIDYDGFGGLYRGDLNLQIYWDDNADKLARYLSILNDGDYIFIPTNHQYAQTTRIPERYPLTTAYYRALIGCPEDKDIIWCYRVAEPGMFEGQLGFDLVATFEDYPTLGSFVINDQAAEEAFTFYDHPKVLIFQKSADYDPAQVAALLGAVDLSNVVRLLPGQADDYKDLMLSENQAAIQQAGGTWSELFDRDAILNKYPGLGLVAWYILIFVVGLFAFPLVRAALPGLADNGYPLARVAGLLLWAWLVWLAGSNGIAYSKTNIGIALGLMALVGAWQAWRQRGALKEEWGRRWKLYLFLEILFLAFFLLDLFIRLGNPDLWHPSKGGERPMNFAQLNAVLKSTTFPPYDAWYSGGYINYYYFGDVIVGTPVKLLGIVPSIAFNFILPTLFACVAMAVFSVGYNLIKPRLPDPERWSLKNDIWPLLTGFSASAAIVLLGNLGVVRLFILGFQRNGAPGGVIEGANLFEKVWWTFKGFILTVAGLPLPYSPGDWYWFASRIFVYPHDEFYEFPVFSFVWSDLHAHVIAYMLTILVIAWVISLLHSKAKWGSRTDAALGLFLGALVIGSLKPANTWDFYTYFVFGMVGVFYAVARYAKVNHLFPNLPDWVKRLTLAGGAVVLLTGLALLFYQPFTHWFGQAYSSINKWTGLRTPMTAYLVQWGLLLFFIVSWMAWETRQWLAETPVSALRKLRPYRDLILAALVIVLLVLVVQQVWVMLPTQTPPWEGATVLWLVLPLALWAGVLMLFRPGLADMKRLVLFMTGTGLLLTMFVELFTIAGDVGRMNTIYKFGVQSWVLLGVSAAASFGWLLVEVRKWLPGWRVFWQASATLLVIGASLFLLVAGVNKVRDRWILEAPHTLDSMDYMQYATYAEFGRTFSTAEDYRAIVWMQENIQGSPVIVEAAPVGIQYTWFSRYSIYTGLPAVVGWQWHEQQQRVYFQPQVIQRGFDVDNFYVTTDINAAVAFLQKYNVRYIIVGQLERGKYAPGAESGPVLAGEPDGLLKFEQFDGIFWNEIYRDGETVIYEVAP